MVALEGSYQAQWYPALGENFAHDTRQRDSVGCADGRSGYHRWDCSLGV